MRTANGRSSVQRDPSNVGGHMEMFLVALFTSLFGLGIAIAGFGLATRDEEEEEPQEQPQRVSMPPGNLLPNDPPSVIPTSRLPSDLLMLQLERHIRLELAAAEAYLDSPTTEMLHARTSSPLAH
ncbi:hypothetical protein ACGF5M_04875 [Gemmatimonadota bacterium]